MSLIVFYSPNTCLPHLQMRRSTVQGMEVLADLLERVEAGRYICK